MKHKQVKQFTKYSDGIYSTYNAIELDKQLAEYHRQDIDILKGIILSLIAVLIASYIIATK